MITSTHNPKIKWVRTLQSQARARREEQVFAIEGVRLAEEALAAGWQARLVLYTEDLSPRGQAVRDGFAGQGAQVECVAAHVLAAASDTETPQGILVVLSGQELPTPQALDFVFIPDGVRDPGNLGTMLRTAAAAGVQAVFCPPETADAFAPKVLRAGMGAQFRLLVVALSWEGIAARLRPQQIYLAAAGQGIPYTQADFRSPAALVVGGEAAGASSQAHGLATTQIHIPMPGGSESLNAAIAAGILLFEVVRQRSAASG
jgi:RNA methyltransferase, TrmH family